MKSIANTLLLAAGLLFLGLLPAPQAHGTPVIDYNFEDGSIAGWNTISNLPSTYLSVVDDPLRADNKVMEVDDTSTSTLRTLSTTPAFSPVLTSGIYVLTLQFMASKTGGDGSDYTFDRRISLTQSGDAATYTRIRSNGDNSGLIAGIYNGAHTNVANLSFDTWYEFTQTINLDAKTWSFSINDVITGLNIYTSTTDFGFFINISNINNFTITQSDDSGRGGLFYLDNVKLEAADGYTFTTSSTNAQYWSDTNGWSPVGLPGAGDNAKVWGTAGGTTNQTFLTDGDRTVKNLILGGNNATGQLRLRSGSSDTLTVTETLTVTNRAVALASADTNHVLTVNATNLVVDTKNDANILSLGLSDGRVSLNVAGNTTVTSGAIHINRGDQGINLGHLSLGDKALLLSGTNFSDAGGTNYSVQVRSLSGNAGSAISNGYAAHTILEILGENTSAATYSGTISNGAGVVALTKQGAGTQVLAGHNTFTGVTTISGGVLELKSTNGPALGATASLTIASNATLLISTSNQINNTNTTVTLSGGTIKRASGVSETFGDLNLVTDSTLDFGSGTEGTLNFGTYTPSALLTVNNFFKDNVLTFKSDLTSTISDSSYFSFSGAFSSSWDEGSGVFTITAIPEPSTTASAAVLLGLMLCPLLRRNPRHRHGTGC